MNKVIPIYTDPYEDLHTCPYLEDIYNDHETLCDCDEEQIRNCMDDI